MILLRHDAAFSCRYDAQEALLFILRRHDGFRHAHAMLLDYAICYSASRCHAAMMLTRDYAFDATLRCCFI